MFWLKQDENVPTEGKSRSKVINDKIQTLFAMARWEPVEVVGRESKNHWHRPLLL